MNRQLRSGFSLVEMVIVILIMGMLAAVATPKMFDRSSSTESNTTRKQLAVMRNALEMYRARSGFYPPEGSLPLAMTDMLNRPFPSPSIGTARGKSGVYYDTNSNINLPVVPDVEQDAGWAYKPANGTLKINLSSSEPGADW